MADPSVVLPSSPVRRAAIPAHPSPPADANAIADANNAVSHSPHSPIRATITGFTNLLFGKSTTNEVDDGKPNLSSPSSMDWSSDRKRPQISPFRPHHPNDAPLHSPPRTRRLTSGPKNIIDINNVLERHSSDQLKLFTPSTSNGSKS